MILSGADNRPPMLNKDLYDSWKSIMELYMQNREHGRMILESVEHGHLIRPTAEENGVIKTKKYAELSAAKKIQVDCDMKATNIILQGLHADIYLLVNHHRAAKDLWERVQLLMQGFVVPVFSLGDVLISCLNKVMAFLTFVVLRGSPLPIISSELPLIYETKPLFKTTWLQCNKFRGDKGKIILVLLIRVMLLVQREILQVDRQGLLNATIVKVKGIWIDNPHSLNDQGMLHGTEDLDTYDLECDDLLTAQAVLMANISNYGSDIILEVPNSETYLNDMDSQSYQNPFYLKKAQRIKPTLYDGIVISKKHVVMPVTDDEETLILEKESRSKMLEKEKDPEAIKQNISHKPIDYEKLNRLTEDFGKRFTPQQELSAEQAFWLHISNPTVESSSTPPVRVEVPSELPKVSLVNESLKKLKFQLTQFDFVVKKRTTLDALTEGEWGFKHTKVVFNNENFPFLKSLKNIFNVFDKDLLNEIKEVQTVFDQVQAAVQQSSVDKQCLEIANKELLLKNDRLSIQIMSQDIVSTVMNCMSLNVDCMHVCIHRSKSYEKCLNLDAEFSKSKQASNSLQDDIISGLPPYSAITPNEPVDSLSMGDEHLNTIPATKSDEFIKSCVENLVPNPSESEGKNGCDLPACFKTFSNVLFDADYESDSNQHHFNTESDRIESMLNHDSSIIPSSSKIDSLLDEFTGELTLLKSIPLGIDKTDCYHENEIRFTKRLLYDNSSPRPPKEFISKNSNADIESFSPSPIPIKDSDSHMEEIDLTFLLLRRLILFLMSSPVNSFFSNQFHQGLIKPTVILKKKFVLSRDCCMITHLLVHRNNLFLKNSDTAIESFSSFPNPVEDNDSFMEEIDLSFTPDDPMPSGIEEDDYDSERDILILEDLLSNDSLSLPENESFHFDIPSSSRPPAKPPVVIQEF
uniref:Uncharacterized protein n=1 Tax=Tanacetum cinerariifolium TaxID=118510 RepID=A0A6L2L3N7_TANCI|nr:hypothetical protein [Tanacetum cinerariifolium]